MKFESMPQNNQETSEEVKNPIDIYKEKLEGLSRQEKDFVYGIKAHDAVLELIDSKIKDKDPALYQDIREELMSLFYSLHDVYKNPQEPERKSSIDLENLGHDLYKEADKFMSKLKDENTEVLEETQEEEVEEPKIENQAEKINEIKDDLNVLLLEFRNQHITADIVKYVVDNIIGPKLYNIDPVPKPDNYTYDAFRALDGIRGEEIDEENIIEGLTKATSALDKVQ